MSDNYEKINNKLWECINSLDYNYHKFLNKNSSEEFVSPVEELILSMTKSAWEESLSLSEFQETLFWNFFVGKDKHVKIIPSNTKNECIQRGQSRISLYELYADERNKSNLMSFNKVLELISKKLDTFYFDTPIIVNTIDIKDISLNGCRVFYFEKPAFLQEQNFLYEDNSWKALDTVLKMVDEWVEDASNYQEILVFYNKLCNLIKDVDIFQLDDDDIFLVKGIYKYLAWVFWSFPDMNTFVYIPASTGKSCALPMGSAIGFSQYKIDLINWFLRSSMSVFFYVEQILDSFYGQVLNREYTRSAIGSIMSRNGSHNIGSHVLAALTHNVGTMPDDRVLYQYIQQRMDYIATVTTDFPNWSVSTRFVGDVMRTFFSQRHLLEHISESEGLHAYRFQGNVSDDNNLSNAIQIKIFGYQTTEDNKSLPEIINQGTICDAEFIKYDLDYNTSISLENDISIAIPGGIVGQHAFYTILENFIRNAAKHSWSKNGNNNTNLIINIAFLNNASKDYISFLVWDELSNVKDNLIETLSSKLKDPFIKDGKARQENWGLAEMKISAGFLQKRNIKEIGGLSDSINDDIIIEPVSINGKLGYSFNIPRPKDILIVVDNSFDLEQLNAKLYGIYFETIDNLKKAIDKDNGSKFLSLDYSFIVICGPESNDINEIKLWLPYRFIYIPELKEPLLSLNYLDVRKIVYARWLSQLRDKYWRDKRGQVCEAPETINVVLKVDGDSGAEQGLVTDRDVFVTMFLECYHSIVSDIILDESEHSRRKKRIGTIADEERFALFVFSQIGISRDEITIKDNDLSIERMKNDLRDTLKNHFEKVSENLSDLTLVRDACIEINNKNYIEALSKVNKNKYQYTLIRRLISLQNNGRIDEQKECEKFIQFIQGKKAPESLKEAFDGINGNTKNNMRGSKDSNLSRIIALGQNRSSSIFEELEDSFVSAFLASDIYLRKYEERIVTLPNGYRIQSTIAPDDEKFESVSICEGDNPPVAKLVKNGKNGHIFYRRHDTSIEPGAIYTEALSGSQSYLNALAQMGKDCNDTDMKQLLLMTETGLLRMLIIDERADKFLRDHDEMGTTFANMGIGIVDIELSKSSQDYENGLSINSNAWVKIAGLNAKQDSTLKINDGEFDILIIHQGIIDKWWPDLKHDSKKVGEIIRKLKEVVPYVVITTGRGRPDNIPKWAKVLPFSSVESLLFRKYPEKMLLVNTVMSILPLNDDVEIK